MLKIGTLIYRIIATVALFLGILGAFLPLLPTTVFLIISLWAANRSSPRLRNWLLQHPRFGPILTNWQAHKIIPKKAKIMACSMMTISYIWFACQNPPLWQLLGLAAIFIATIIYLLNHPSSPPNNPTEKAD